MNLKKTFWKYISIIFVSFIILNPEMFELALFINTVGLDLFLLLLEIQLLAITGTLLTPVFMRIRLLLKRYIYILPSKIIMDRFSRLKFNTQGPATIMHILVLTVALDIAL